MSIFSSIVLKMNDVHYTSKLFFKNLPRCLPWLHLSEDTIGCPTKKKNKKKTGNSRFTCILHKVFYFINELKKINRHINFLIPFSLIPIKVKYGKIHGKIRV